MSSSTRNEPSKGKTRSYLALLGLSVITLTIYYFYWLYINLREIKHAFPADQGSTVVDTARVLFFVKIGILIVTGTVATGMILPTALSDPFQIQFPPAISMFKIIEFLSSILFFYFFCRSIGFAKQKAGIPSVSMSAAIFIYFASAVLDAMTTVYFLQGNFLESLSSVDSISSLFTSLSDGLLPLISQLDFLGSILWLIAMYLAQREINRVWQEGSIKEVSYNAFDDSSEDAS